MCAKIEDSFMQPKTFIFIPSEKASYRLKLGQSSVEEQKRRGVGHRRPMLVGEPKESVLFVAVVVDFVVVSCYLFIFRPSTPTALHIPLLREILSLETCDRIGRHAK